MNPRNKPWNQFFELIEAPTTPSSRSGSRALRKELVQAGADPDRVSRTLEPFLRARLPRVEPEWLIGARKAQASFESMLKSKTSWLSDRYQTLQELMTAVAKGDLGWEAREKAHVFFRKKGKSMSEKELRSMLKDIEILSELKKP